MRGEGGEGGEGGAPVMPKAVAGVALLGGWAVVLLLAVGKGGEGDVRAKVIITWPLAGWKGDKASPSPSNLSSLLTTIIQPASSSCHPQPAPVVLPTPKDRPRRRATQQARQSRDKKS